MRFVNQENWNVVADGIYATARSAFQLVLLFVISERSFADWAGEDLEQIAVDHNGQYFSALT
jgi:hypothetical protein